MTLFHLRIKVVWPKTCHKCEIFTTKGQISKIPNLFQGSLFPPKIQQVYVCVCERNVKLLEKILGI